MIKKLMAVLLAMLIAVHAVLAIGFASEYAINSGERLNAELGDEPIIIKYTPGSNSEYTVYVFPAQAGDEVNAGVEIYHGSQRVAHGNAQPDAVSAWLTSGEEYTIRITGSGSVVIEVARHTHSRCFSDPIELSDGGSYSKLLATSGDTHWYCFEAMNDGMATIICVPEDSAGLKLSGCLVANDGSTIAMAQPNDGGSFSISAILEKGTTYRVRISSPDGGTGGYALVIARDLARKAEPAEIVLSKTEMTIERGRSESLHASVFPEGAYSVILWWSSDTSVATVSQTGAVTAVGSGEAVINAVGYGGVSAQCSVTVKGVELESMNFDDDKVTLKPGEKSLLHIVRNPSDADAGEIEYVSSDESVATVDENGLVTAVSSGQATITATAEGSEINAKADVIVDENAVTYRALLVGEENYLSDVNTVRDGSFNSVISFMNLLYSLDFDGRDYSAATLTDASAGEVLASIRATFEGATENDVSLFYITCHGYYECGMSFFQMVDGTVISARDLELELRKIPGQVVIIADCCGSGGLIGHSGGLDDFTDGVLTAFTGYSGGPIVSGSKYKILVSASTSQDSYRVGFDSEGSSTKMATVFMRAICDGAGWSIDYQKRAALSADINYDSVITLGEMADYAERRVMWYLDIAGSLAGDDYIQTVKAYPEGDSFPLFARSTSE